MAFIDVFNGDADGICALLQLRNAEPRDARLVTGVKRDIELVAKAGIGAGDVATVLDVSFDSNRDAVLAALSAGAEVFYCDHHFAGDVPDHPRLRALIDTAPEVCTSLLINRHLGGRLAAWAVTGAFGDNLDGSAHALADELGLDDGARATLRRLGTCINYNGYGASLEDLHFRPAELFERLRPFADPLAFVAEDRATWQLLTQGYDDDMAKAAALAPVRATPHAAAFVLPGEAWARRVSGVYGNDLANREPGRAHAVLTERADGSWLISVRAPLERRTGADELCRRFPTGGGRAAAAGINALPREMFDDFVQQFVEFYTP
ncbi:MAG: DHH family phosphoesterase [Planctomycetes bacterium]|nr:DHH family phosphoesterase [Planctomycetota bacterium]